MDTKTKDKLKVAYICHVSNADIRQHLVLSDYGLKNFFKRMMGKQAFHYIDYGVWNTIAFEEIEHFPDIELHVINPHPGIKGNPISFEMRGIFYHCFRQQKGNYDKQYHRNRAHISRFIDDIKPDVIILKGIEQPFYSLCALDIDTKKYPLIGSMQACVSAPGFLKNYPLMKPRVFRRCLQTEHQVIKHVQYISTNATFYRNICRQIKPNAEFVCFHDGSRYASLDMKHIEKRYDFVYTAADIAKAGEDALKAYIVAARKHPELTLHFVGGYASAFKERLIELAQQNHCEDKISFSGLLSPDEARKEMAKARYALVPVKVDTVPCTIWEAIYLQLPVITFATHGTPGLNREGESVLIADIDDHEQMGQHMIRLVEDSSLAASLNKNANAFAAKYWDNTVAMRLQADMYHAVYEHFHHRTPIPEHISKAIF